MFITKDLCYLEMYKTGSQHIVKLLEKSVPEGKRIGNHNRPNDEVYKSNIYFLGSIRNPWDWYVSLWNFGCEKRGSLYNRLTSKKIYLVTCLKCLELSPSSMYGLQKGIPNGWKIL